MAALPLTRLGGRHQYGVISVEGRNGLYVFGLDRLAQFGIELRNSPAASEISGGDAEHAPSTSAAVSIASLFMAASTFPNIGTATRRRKCPVSTLSGH